VLTGLAQIVIALSAAGAGALLAQKFGRSAKTDGFLAAYGVYLVLVLAAQTFRLVVVPDLTRARPEGRLGGEARAYAVSFLALAIPVSILVAVFSGPLGDLITGSLPPQSAHIAARAVEVLVPAAFVQLLAALAASALAAVDSYGTAAAGFALGGIVGLLVFALLAAGGHGIVSLAWGLLANATVALAIPLVVLLRRRVLVGPRARRLDVRLRLGHLLEGAAVPLALQGSYLVALRLSAKLGVGSVTTFSYAYLAASTLVAATAFSLGIISSAPLTRRGIDEEAAGQHVVHAAWVSLSLVGAAAGVFALVGGSIVQAVLGNHFKGQVGRELGHLVVYLSPWMVAWVAFAVTYPLVFVAGRRKALMPIAAVGFVFFIPLGLVFRSAWGLAGIAVALGLSTLVISLGLLWAISTRTLEIAVAGLARLALAVGGAAALAFGGLSLALQPAAAAVLGVGVYALMIFSMRSLGLSAAWSYVRGLH